MTSVGCDKLYKVKYLEQELKENLYKTLYINQNGVLKYIQVTHRKVGKIKWNREQKKQRTKHKMEDISPSLLVITLNVNFLNTPGERQRLAEWI